MIKQCQSAKKSTPSGSMYMFSMSILVPPTGSSFSSSQPFDSHISSPSSYLTLILHPPWACQDHSTTIFISIMALRIDVSKLLSCEAVQEVRRAFIALQGRTSDGGCIGLKLPVFCDVMFQLGKSVAPELSDGMWLLFSVRYQLCQVICCLPPTPSNVCSQLMWPCDHWS